MIPYWSVALTACLLLVVSSCGSNDEKSLAAKPAELEKYEKTAKLKRIWSSTIGEGQDRRYSRFTPAVVDGVIYSADAEGRVFAHSLEKGRRLWRVNTKLNIGGAIAANETQVFFGTYDGEVVALDSSSGEQLWKAQVSSEVVAPPAVSDEIVVAQAIDGRVVALSASDGGLLWSYDHPVPVLSLRGTASPAIVTRQVILAFDNGQLLSLGLQDGVAQWDVRVSRPQGRTELERIVDIDGAPLVQGAFIYAASYQGRLVAINRGTGRVMWTKDINTANRLALGHGNIYASDMNGKIYAFNSLTGDVVWQSEALKNRGPRAPTVIGDYVAVIEEEDDYLHLMSSTDGTFAYRFKPAGNRFRSPSIAADDVLYVLADNGKLSAYSLAE